MPYRHALILQVITKPGQAPFGVCPLFVPGSEDFLGVYPLTGDSLRLPADADALQAEAQLAVFAELEYDGAGRVEAVIPRMAGAFAGGTVGEAGMKWSVRKHWGVGSCAFTPAPMLLAGWPMLAGLPLTVETPAGKAQTTASQAYPWLAQSGEAWLVFAMNSQADGGSFERISTRLAQADRPAHALIALGAFAPSAALRVGETMAVTAGESQITVRVR